MISLKRRLPRLTLLPTALLVVVPAVALAAGSSSQVWVTSTCLKEQYKPKSVILACGDGNTALENLTWSSWSATAAYGAGTFSYNTCTPSCVVGKVVSYPAKVVLSKPKACKKESHKTFTAVKVTYTGPKSRHVVTRGTIFCPI